MDEWSDRDPEGPLDQDLVDNGEDSISCPACGRDVYEDADQCVHCGEWIIPSTSRAGGLHWLWSVAAILALGAMIVLSVLL